MRVFTMQMGKRYEAQKRGIRVVDTTVKTSDRLFSPTWALVLGYKNGEISEEDYARQYRQMMRESWMRHRVRWEEVLRSEEWMALACYCPAGEFCHRLLLKDIFQELCGKLNIPFEYYGELV